ncbi:MAG: glycoside hydrolase family 2, partial [Sphingobacteriales bacterium]
SADFTFYGGLYRNVKLVAAEPVHFSFNKKGGEGIYISTPVVNKSKASVHIKASITNNNLRLKQLVIATVLYDAKGRQVTKSLKPLMAEAGKDNELTNTIDIKNPELWSPDKPYLYKLVTSIIDAGTGKKIEEKTNSVGLRYFYFDAGKGFYLNGKPLKLIGASRHQDFKGLGNAVPDSIAKKDVAMLKEMGANFLRVAHYPQSPAVLQACDELGLLASVEIPVVNEITETDSFYNNCMQMQQEMIQQHFNHPSVIIWCYMNEVLLRPSFNNDKERQKIYFSNIEKLARRLENLTRREDNTRYTMMAHHGNYNLYKEVGLVDIPMIVGWNLYQGWYGANINDLPAYLDKFHNDYPAKPMMITEYGADADPRIRTAAPIRFDKSVEYATAFHQYYFKEIMQRPFVAGAQVWNLADFNSETRNETMPHINNKGLLQWNRTAKDPYYFYKAVLPGKSFIKILGDDKRSAIADSNKNYSSQLLQLAGNVSTATMLMNGRDTVVNFKEGIVNIILPFKQGNNEIQLSSKNNGITITDKRNIYFELQPDRFSNNEIAFKQINILCGAKRSFTDSAGNLWLPDQAYKTGAWGYTGGTAFKLTKSSIPYGTDKNIKFTGNDPIYQTQQTGLENYKFDVPDGAYELTLHFAELLGGTVSGLLYNLDAGGRVEDSSSREFSVLVNNKALVENLNIAQQYGMAVPVVKTVTLNASNSKGIYINFKALKGLPVLNSIQLKKKS